MVADGLVVSEVFGPTWQGEGPSLGRRAGFVRLGRCNLACSFCDTPYTWDWDRFDPAQELTTREAADVAAEILSMDVPLAVITGGEPLLQQRHLPALLAPLRAAGVRVEIETAGTLPPTPEVAEFVDAFNVSPKLANSGNDRDRRYHPEVLSALAATGRSIFKFVVTHPSDLDEIATIVAACGLDEVWVMAEGTDATTIVERTRALAPAVEARGWHLTTRLHVLIWGDRRGV